MAIPYRQCSGRLENSAVKKPGKLPFHPRRVYSDRDFPKKPIPRETNALFYRRFRDRLRGRLPDHSDRREKHCRGCSSDLSPIFHDFTRLLINVFQRKASNIPRRKYRSSTLDCFQKAEAFLNLKLIILRMPDSIIPLPHIRFLS